MIRIGDRGFFNVPPSPTSRTRFQSAHRVLVFSPATDSENPLGIGI